MHRKEKILFIASVAVLTACFAVFIIWRMQKPKAVITDLSSVGNTLSQEGLTTATVPGTVLELKRRFGLLENDYPDILYFTPESFMNVEEILVVRTTDEASADRVEEAIRTSVQGWKDLFENYGTNQFGLLNDSILYRNESYVCYAAGEQAEDVMREIRAAIER
ncbi:MAG: DUF4358 domain-containing protein [Lachnospiraceae bacterium]|nr:DUF4358 domain-containing protein [Lachnospiraceae bacterium]MBR4768318.1 DUF4358 domain-containing protein [Lachnospiraceae bacterium]